MEDKGSLEGLVSVSHIQGIKDSLTFYRDNPSIDSLQLLEKGHYQNLIKQEEELECLYNSCKLDTEKEDIAMQIYEGIGFDHITPVRTLEKKRDNSHRNYHFGFFALGAAGMSGFPFLPANLLYLTTLLPIIGALYTTVRYLQSDAALKGEIEKVYKDAKHKIPQYSSILREKNESSGNVIQALVHGAETIASAEHIPLEIATEENNANLTKLKAKAQAYVDKLSPVRENPEGFKEWVNFNLGKYQKQLPEKGETPLLPESSNL